MANYKGLDCVIGEITHMACAAKDSIHEQHVYEYFGAMEKYVHTAVPQLFMDCMEMFEEQLVVNFETYLNGEKIHHDSITQGITEILHKAVGEAMRNVIIKI